MLASAGGARLNAADSARHLVRTLFAVTGRWAPYPDVLSGQLPDLEARLGWSAEPLATVLDRLLGDAHPPYQQSIELSVGDTMRAHGVHCEWDADFAPARRWCFEPDPGTAPPPNAREFGPRPDVGGPPQTESERRVV